MITLQYGTFCMSPYILPPKHQRISGLMRTTETIVNSLNLRDYHLHSRNNKKMNNDKEKTINVLIIIITLLFFVYPPYPPIILASPPITFFVLSENRLLCLNQTSKSTQQLFFNSRHRCHQPSYCTCNYYRSTSPLTTDRLVSPHR